MPAARIPRRVMFVRLPRRSFPRRPVQATVVPLKKWKICVFFCSVGGTDLPLMEVQILLPREACLIEREEHVCFFRSARGMPLRKGRTCYSFLFRERHGFTSGGGMDLLPREARPYLSERETHFSFLFRKRHRFTSDGGMDFLP